MRTTLVDFSQALNADRLQAVKRRLEFLSPGWMLVAGLAVGLGIGLAALFGIGGWVGLGICLVPLGTAVWLSLGAEPVMKHPPEPKRPEAPETPVEPEQEAEPEGETIRIVEDITELLVMIELPGGTFMMGSPDSDYQAHDWEKPQHEVTVSVFCLGRFPVTRGLYREVMGRGPSEWSAGAEDKSLPANYVSWFDAVSFCNALSERQGLRPCYRIDGEQVTWNQEVDGYRLPTEAEWEYAVRAETTTRWFFGDSWAELKRYAWFDKNSGHRVHLVGEKEPNPWGFYDMIGNVWEWCWDWYDGYDAAPLSDPIGPDSGEYRVLRGGASWDEAWLLRSAVRNWLLPRRRGVVDGFRLARAPRRQP